MSILAAFRQRMNALQPTQKQCEICICAAVKFADGHIVRGHRHSDCFRTASGWTPVPPRVGSEQGFMTSRNRFVGRREGAALQIAAGIRAAADAHGAYLHGELYSEDLY